jgi:uncharacterized DUF497 family protein
VRIEYDVAKSAKNERERGLPFEMAQDFDLGNAMAFEERRGAELRVRAVGMLNGKLHTLVYTKREDAIRIISLRRANKTERRLYEAR